MKLQQQIGFVLLLAALLAFPFPKGFAQAEVTVVYNDGSESSFSILQNGRMYFDGDILMIDDGSGNTPEAVQVESVRKVLLQEQQITATDEVEGNELSVYPVPCKDELFIRNTNSGNVLVEIYSLTGGLLLKQEVADGRIDVSRLEAGIYLIKVEGITRKFYKL